MFSKKLAKTTFFLCLIAILLNSCAPFNSVDARKFPPEPEKRVKKNLEEGRGFRLNDQFKNKGTNYEFATSNPLWRASLDVLDFLPLTSVNYSGGIIISDWYSTEQDNNESIKISIRFLTNEIRSDALDIKIFTKKCENINNCQIYESSGELNTTLKKKILKIAKVYEVQTKDKNFKPYEGKIY